LSDRGLDQKTNASYDGRVISKIGIIRQTELVEKNICF